MADENITEAQRQMTEAMAAVQRDLALFGRMTVQTAEQVKDAEMKAKYGIDNFTAGTKKGAEAVTALASAGIAAGKAMLDGKKGATAFNQSLDELTTAATAAGTALALLIPGGIIIKGLIAGLTLATGALLKYTQAANDMTDKLYTGFQSMSKAGAAASDGMTGLFEGTKKLGLSMNELNEYVQIVGENSRDLALMGGSVYKGRQEFENIGKAMEPARKGLLAMGMLPKDIAEGQMGYLRTQTRLGNAQKMTVDQLAQGARAYLVEQDALTKLTGQTRKETEKAREDALMDQQFGAKIRQLQLAGRDDEAKRLQDMFDMANAVTPELGKSVKALVTGNLTNEDAVKLYQSTQGQALRDLQEVQVGTKSVAQGMQSIANSVGKTNDTLGVTYGQLGINNSFLMDFGAARKLQIAGEQGFEKQLAKIRADQLRQGVEGGKSADAMLEKQKQLVEIQIKANENMERFVKEGIPAAQTGMIAIARASEAAARALYNLAHDHGPGAERNMINQPLTNEQGMDFGQLSGADGGVFKGPTTGYPVLMHGTEAIIPMDKLTGASKLSGIDSMLGAQDAKGGYLRKITKDTETLAKLTNADVNRTKDFDALSKRYIDLKTELMEQEITLLENQKNQPKTTAGGGVGLQMPAATNLPSMGGAQGMQIKSQDDLKKMGLNIKSGDVQAAGAKISPKILELARAIQSGVPGFSYFSSFNDRFHQESAPTSQHTQGLAVDFTVAQPPSIEDGRAITSWLKQMGASVAIDEYNSPTAKATGGHFHAQIPAFEEGGELGKGKIGIAGEAGPELITGPAGITPMNDLMGAFNNMSSLMKKQVDMLDELVRAQKNGNDISSKMLRMQA